MLSGLDPHSSYMEPKAFRDMQVQTRGEFGGLGIEVTMEDGLIKVVSPIDETPAAKAGVMANDIITKLDEEQVQGLTLNQAVEKMRGPVNTKIKLTIMRKGQDKPVEVSITRDVIRVRAVRSRQEDDVGYIRITQFNEQTTENLKKAISDLQTQIRPRSSRASSSICGTIRAACSIRRFGVGRVPRARRDRFDPRPQRRRDAALQRPRRRMTKGKPVICWSTAARRRHRKSWPAPCRTTSARPCSARVVRQGLGADHHPARRRQRRAAADNGALLHAVGPVDPGQGHRAGNRSAAGRAGGTQGAHRHQGQILAARPSQGRGRRATGSQSYVPPEPKDDKALKRRSTCCAGRPPSGLPAEPEARGQPAIDAGERRNSRTGRPKGWPVAFASPTPAL